MEFWLSATGVKSRTKDLGPDTETDENVHVDRAIRVASGKVSQWATAYVDAQLAESDWVTDATAAIAAVKTSVRRGMSVTEALREEAREYEDWLKGVIRGNQIPGVVTAHEATKNAVPSVQNVIWEGRYSVAKKRTQEAISNAPDTSLTRHKSSEEQVGFYLPV